MSNTPSSFILEESPGLPRVTPRGENPLTPRDPPNIGRDYFTPTGTNGLPHPYLSSIRCPSGLPSPGSSGRRRDLRYNTESNTPQGHGSRSPTRQSTPTSVKSRSERSLSLSRRSILGLSPLESNIIQDTATLVSPRKSAP